MDGGVAFTMENPTGNVVNGRVHRRRFSYVIRFQAIALLEPWRGDVGGLAVFQQGFHSCWRIAQVSRGFPGRPGR